VNHAFCCGARQLVVMTQKQAIKIIAEDYLCALQTIFSKLREKSCVFLLFQLLKYSVLRREIHQNCRIRPSKLWKAPKLQVWNPPRRRHRGVWKFGPPGKRPFPVRRRRCSRHPCPGDWYPRSRSPGKRHRRHWGKRNQVRTQFSYVY